MKPVAVTAYTAASALGVGLEPTLAALREARSGLALQRFETDETACWLGLVPAIDDVRLPASLADHDCRNNRLAELALRADGFADAVGAAAQRWGPARIGVFLGTSTSGILATEVAYRHRDALTGALPASLHYAQTHNTYSVARYLRAALALPGPAHVVSTACSSSAKVFATAQRYLAAGWVDAAVVGGVDSLCLTTLYGFRSLELVSEQRCRPWDADRTGLSLGEAGAFALLERDADDRAQAWLLGAGETSDGHHMSSPHPTGAGAAAAMQAALDAAGLQADQVDYLNLHGTGTPGNDAAEDRAVCTVFGTALPCSSTKASTGHTLGAAGGLEAAIAMLSLQHGWMPGGLGRERPDAALQAHYLDHGRAQPLRVVASNSFGFGGSNCCLLFGAAA